MILYLQKNSNGTFAIAEKNNRKSEMFDCYYYILVDNILGNTTYQAIANLVMREFDCKKLVINF